jgi:hypothetical protein
VAARMPGVYLLLRGGSPVYVGRSDTCVQTRLASHPYIGVAEHFVWQPCRSVRHAFHLEPYWFHALQDMGGAGNLIHPARPAGKEEPCPFCPQHNDVSITYAVPAVQYPNGADATTLEAA